LGRSEGTSNYDKRYSETDFAVIELKKVFLETAKVLFFIFEQNAKILPENFLSLRKIVNKSRIFHLLWRH